MIVKDKQTTKTEGEAASSTWSIRRDDSPDRRSNFGAFDSPFRAGEPERDRSDGVRCPDDPMLACAWSLRDCRYRQWQQAPREAWLGTARTWPGLFNADLPTGIEGTEREIAWIAVKMSRAWQKVAQSVADSDTCHRTRDTLIEESKSMRITGLRIVSKFCERRFANDGGSEGYEKYWRMFNL